MNRISDMCLAAGVGMVLFASPCHADEQAVKWDRNAAVAAMDARAAEWADWDKSQRSLDTTCISCHSGGPYLLLRSSMHDTRDVAAPFDKLMASVRTRVLRWSDVEPWYAFNTEKKAESLGTEAIWNALIVASNIHVPGDALEQKALDHLWALQRDDGAWDWLDFNLEPWESSDARVYGAALAALAIARSEATAHDGVGKLKSYLSNQSHASLHSRMHVLWASTELAGVLSDSQRDTIVDELRTLQKPDGGWSLADFGEWRIDFNDESDGYATGLATLVLQRVNRLQDADEVERGLQWLRAHQDTASGEWFSESVNKVRDPETFRGRFMRDSATVFAVMALMESEMRQMEEGK